MIKFKTILVQILYDLKNPTEPYPKSFIDVWDENHVRMPFSTKNIYPVKNGDKKELCSRWELIQNALRKELLCAEDLEDAILSYNMRFKASLAARIGLFGLVGLKYGLWFLRCGPCARTLETENDS